MTPRPEGAPSIAVVGAGIGGLTLAACLLRVGVRVTLYEQAQAFSRVGAGIQMGPNAMRILARLGLRERLEPLAFSPPELANREWDSGELTFALPMRDAEATYGAPYFLLHRGDLHEALATLVPDDMVRLDHKLARIEEGAGDVRLEFENGRCEHADLVIAADGVHSPVRQALFSSETATFTGRVAYRTVFPAELLAADRRPAKAATKWWGPDRHIVVYYVSGGREVYFTTSVPDEGWTIESWSREGSVDELRAAFRGFHPEVTAVLHGCPTVHKWAIYDREPLPTWHTGRIALLGDACHPMTPYMAQGAATAMEDGVVLSRCLELFGPNRADTALATYEAARKPRTSKIQAESRTNRWLYRSQNPHWVYDYDAWNVA
ncbi:MAG: FAD-dependent monooxygenase, partial [Pseudonocardia sp.]|nr:FAD-dependent monooxygenase [Pseudonocardia sp.]